MKYFVVSLCCFLLSANVFGQTVEDSVAVYGNVQDSFTCEILKGVRVEIMREDSSLIRDFEANTIYGYGGYSHNIDEIGYLYVPRTTLLFRFSKEGYVTQTITLHKKDVGRREKRFFLGEILLKKRSKSLENELGAATVTASKIRMVVKGDTLVYNADAFQLSEGSMLDGLIKCLPGFELRGGQIRVNGQYVSSLLVNGEDFFRGDPRVALENLPAYMVDKVKVYHKEHDYSYITKERDKDELPLVVDVNLKRQYAIGWVANAGVGYGLENRYVARLFALRFTNNSRLAVFGNANNTNDTREPGVTGDWSAQGVASGNTEMQTGGFETLIKDKKGVWKYTGNAKVAHRRTDDRSVTSAETFLPVGSSFSRMRRENIANNLQLITAHQYSYKKPTSHITLKGDAAYRRNRNRSNRWAAEFSADPKDAYRAAALDSIFLGASERLAKMLINRQKEQQKTVADYWSGDVRLNGYFAVPHTPDYINLSADIHVEKRDAISFSDYSLYMNSTSATDRLLRHVTSPEVAFDAAVKATYAYRPDWGNVRPFYDFKESYRDAELSSYRLDRLAEDMPEYGELPSSVAALMSCLDAPNSYASRLNTQKHRVGMGITYWLPGKWPSHSISITPEAEWRIDHLTYHRDLLHAKSHRSKLVFLPAVSWGFDNCRINYRLTSAYPNLLNRLAYTDTADPLNLYQGNPNLKRSINHEIDFSRSFFDYKKGWHLYLKGGWNATRNAISHAMNYDAVTGVRTFSPRNVNGNWGMNFSVDYQQPINKKQSLVFTAVTDVNYQNSVDYVTERSVVRNLNIGEKLRLNMRIKQHIFDLDVAVKFLHATSPNTHFQTINSFDFKYSASAQIVLPAGMLFSTDLTLYHRTGYTDSSLNDCHFVANARLSKSFFKGRLGLNLTAFDIFNGLSNVTKVINAQGITETWHNSLPSYALLQVVYKFSKQPRKK